MVAVDDAGQRSAATAPVTAAPDAAAAVAPALPLAVNFARTTAPTAAAGWVKDFGQAFTNTRGYGWVVPGSSTPLSLVGNGRIRDRSAPATPSTDRQRGLPARAGQRRPATSPVCRAR